MPFRWVVRRERRNFGLGIRQAEERELGQEIAVRFEAVGGDLSVGQPRLLLFSLNISSHHSARGEAVAPIEVFHPSFPPPHSPLGSPQEVERFFSLLLWQDDLSMRKGLLP